MKYRQGFVTNSSSTSYIIALNNNVKFDENKLNEIAKRACDAYFSENWDEVEEWEYEDAFEEVLRELEMTLEYGKVIGDWKIEGFGGYDLYETGEYVASGYLPNTDEVQSYSWGG